MSPLLHVVLHEPEIPNNTGNIGRTCVALDCALHLIHPLGFDLDEKACRRAGLDYWPRLDVREHDSLERYLDAHRDARLWVLSTKATRPVWDAAIEPGDHLLFGKETRGLPAEVLDRFSDRLVTLPMVPSERSLNLATAVCAVAYEGVRQLVGSGRVSLDAMGRIARAEG
ncbi:MAG: tRNA (cytidine(34)-2'-O)-methyltransferase [Phycisphaerales bacterium JB041]